MGWIGDLRHVFRACRRQPVLFLTMAATLALGVGLSAAVFSFADGYLFRRLPFPSADQLYFLRDPNARIALLASDAAALRQSEISNFGFVEWSIDSGGLVEIGDRVVDLRVFQVGPRFRQTVELPLVAGRDFTDDDHGAGPLPAWLSHRFWHRELGGARDVLGRSFRLRGRGAVDIHVVGILSPLVTSFDLNNSPPDVVVPKRGREETGPNSLAFPIVRLPDGVTREQGESRIAAVLQVIAPAADRKPRAARLVPLDVQTRGGKPTARVFFSGAMLVLALAAINLMHFLLLRGVARTDEVAVRAALGASGWRLGRLFLTECLVLGIVGIVGGLLLGYGLSQLIATRVPVLPTAGRNLALVPMVFDLRVIAFAVGLGLVVVTIGGVWPAWRAIRRPLVTTRREQGGVAAGIPARLSRVILAAELAVATAILVGTCFLGSGIWRYLDQPLGFDYVDRVAVTVTTTDARPMTSNDAEVVRRAVSGVAGVRGAGPYRFEFAPGLEVPGRAIDPRSVQAVTTSFGYFETWNLQLRAGRWFVADEFRSDAAVAVVDRTFAAAVWPDVDPIGQEVRAVDVRVEPITFNDLFLRDVGEAQFQAPIMVVFGGLAFVLAGVGVFGLVSFLVEQRMREFGIRMTLGARPSDIWRTVVGQSLWPSIAGLVLGIAAARALESVVRSTVFGWESSGVQAVSIVVIALLGIAVFAAALPARRAMRVDPAQPLRAE